MSAGRTVQSLGTGSSPGARGPWGRGSLPWDLQETSPAVRPALRGQAGHQAPMRNPSLFWGKMEGGGPQGQGGAVERTVVGDQARQRKSSWPERRLDTTGAGPMPLGLCLPIPLTCRPLAEHLHLLCARCCARGGGRHSARARGVEVTVGERGSGRCATRPAQTALGESPEAIRAGREARVTRAVF